MAEAITRYIGDRYFDAYSAGPDPLPTVHPQGIQTLMRNRVPVHGLVPKDVALFKDQTFDFVVCLRERDREEATPIPGADVILWNFPDPLGRPDESERRRAFEDVFHGLERRIRLLIAVTRASLVSTPSRSPFEQRSSL